MTSRAKRYVVYDPKNRKYFDMYKTEQVACDKIKFYRDLYKERYTRYLAASKKKDHWYHPGKQALKDAKHNYEFYKRSVVREVKLVPTGLTLSRLGVRS
jgi:hypothetical protein